MAFSEVSAFFSLVRAEGSEPNRPNLTNRIPWDDMKLPEPYGCAMNGQTTFKILVAALPTSAGDSGLTCRGDCP